MTRICFVVAVASNGVIGKDGDLPWRIPADLRHFRKVTVGKPVVMGRKTFESIGRPLDGRTNIVITRNADLPVPEGVLVATDIEQALALAGTVEEVMVIGGAEIYRQTLPLAERIYLTRVERAFTGDAVLPDLGPGWREVSVESGPADADPPYSFVVLERTPTA